MHLRWSQKWPEMQEAEGGSETQCEGASHIPSDGAKYN